MPYLDADRSAAFERDGFLILPGVFDANEVAAMRNDADFVLELIVNSSVANQRQSRRLDIRRRPDGTMVVRKIQPIVDLALYACQVLSRRTPAPAGEDKVGRVGLLGSMSELMGDEPVLMEEKRMRAMGAFVDSFHVSNADLTRTPLVRPLEPHSRAVATGKSR